MSDRQLELRAVAAVITAAVVAYAASLCGDFVYDDIHSISGNAAVASLANIPAFFVDADLFSAANNAMYRPVLMTTYALDFAVSGAEPLGFKATNLCLHAIASVLLYSVARRLGALRVWAAVAAGLFAVHPLNSEAINLVSGRSELLMVVGVLFGVRCHFAAARGSRWALVGTALAAVVACGSKETGVVLPVLMVLTEAGWRLQGRRRDALRVVVTRVLPAALITAGYLLVRKQVLGQVAVDLSSLGVGGDPLSGHGRDLVTQLATMCVVLPRTLMQVLVPLGISLDPPVTFHHHFADPAVLCGLAGLVAITWVGCRAPVRRRGVLFGTAFAWGTSLPWIIIPLNVPLSEHRLYGLLAGLTLVLATSVRGSSIGARSSVAAGWRCAGGRVALAGVAVVGATFAGMAAHRSLDYRDEAVLWEEVLAVDDHNFRARWGLAMSQVRRGQRDAARPNLMVSHAVYPGHVSVRVSLLENILASPADATRPFLALYLSDALIERDAANPYYRILRSEAMLQAGRLTGEDHWFRQAEELALSCLAIAEPKGLVYRTAAAARHAAGDLDGAIELLDQSVDRGLDHLSVLVDRAELLIKAGRRGAAEADLRRAMAQDPLHPMVRSAFERFLAAPAGR